MMSLGSGFWENENVTVWLGLGYVAFFWVLEGQVRGWRKRRLAIVLQDLPERSRALMHNEPWLREPPLPEFDTPQDHAYRKAQRNSKWLLRFVWVAFLILSPAALWLIERTA